MNTWTLRLNDLRVDVSLSGVAVGDLLVRGASKWSNLARPGLVGSYYLSHDGTGSVPSWANTSGLMIDASQLSGGTIATARLGSGTADNTKFLRGDQTWQTVTSGVAVGDSPTWTGQHTFSAATTYFGAAAQSATLRQVAPANGGLL